MCELNSSGTVTATNTFGAAGLLARHTSSSLFYSFDTAGNTAETLNSAGTPQVAYQFYSFGQYHASAAPSDPFGFGGQAGYYTDRSTGLLLLGERYYDPGQGRFLNRDPIGYEGGINLYSYVTNGPLNGSDPSGLKNCLQAIADGDTDMRYDRCYQSNWNAGSRPGVAGAQAFVNQAILMVPGGGLIYMFAGYDVWGCHLSPWQRIIDGAKGVANAFGAMNDVAGMGSLGASGAEPGIVEGGSSPCFVAGTPIPLVDAELASGGLVAASLGTQANAAKPIEQIKQGDVVASRNPHTGQTELKKVVRTFKRTTHEIVHLELADGKTSKVVESLRGTPEHPFFTPTGQVAMGQLKAGMQVITWRGPPLVVKAVSREHYPEGIPVYNFEVEGDHTYFIGTANGGAWVHNDCTKALAKIFQKYPAASLKCDKAAVKALEVLQPIYPDAQIVRVHAMDGAQFFFSHDGTRFAETGYHDFVYAGGKVYDALTGPAGATFEEYWKLWNSGHWGRMKLTP